MSESLDPNSGNILHLEPSPVLGLLENLREQAADPLSDFEKIQYKEDLTQGQMRIATSVGMLYEKCEEKAALDYGLHTSKLKGETTTYLGKAFFVDDLFVRAKFMPSPPDEGIGFILEIIPKTDNADEIMSFEEDADERPKCGLWGNIFKIEDGTYYRYGITSNPTMSDWLPQSRKEYADRRDTQQAFVSIIEACANSLE